MASTIPGIGDFVSGLHTQLGRVRPKKHIGLVQ